MQQVVLMLCNHLPVACSDHESLQQAEVSRYDCRIGDLPPLMGDPAAHLVAYLRLDAGVDRLSAKEGLLSRDRRPENESDMKIRQVLKTGLPDPFKGKNNYDTSSKWMQKALWRLVQVYKVSHHHHTQRPYGASYRYRIFLNDRRNAGCNH